MINLTDENFEKEIQSAGKPVLVDFFATWCEPCAMLAPILEKVEQDLNGQVVLLKANLDEIPLTAQKFGIDRIPTVVLFQGGKPVNGFVGMRSEKDIKSWLEEILNEAERMRKEFAEYAEKNGFKLNPDTKTVDRIIKGLLMNEEKYGKKYCPCRRVTGNTKEDAKKICPCAWHKDEIAKDGKCFCGLYVK